MKTLKIDEAVYEVLIRKKERLERIVGKKLTWNQFFLLICDDTKILDVIEYLSSKKKKYLL